MSQRDDVNVPMIATVGVVSIVLTIAVIYAVQALYYSYANSQTWQKVILAPTNDSDSRLAEQQAKLARYSWSNREEGRVTIPIDRAMKLVTRELRAAQSGRDNAVEPERGS